MKGPPLEAPGMQTRRTFLGAAATVVALAGCSGDGDTATVEEPGGLSVTSPAFEPGGTIPAEFTADGADRSPPLHVEGVP